MVKLDFYFLKMANGEIGFFLTSHICYRAFPRFRLAILCARVISVLASSASTSLSLLSESMAIATLLFGFAGESFAELLLLELILNKRP